jgi:WD40 repeat protein
MVSSKRKLIEEEADPTNISIEPLVSIPLNQNAVVSKPWKKVFAERSLVARNWRKFNYKSKNLIGHTDSVTSLYYRESSSLLITASLDKTIRAWNVETGLCIAVMQGHTDAVLGVQFDDTKIISCSADHSIRIWIRSSFECVRVINGNSYFKKYIPGLCPVSIL